MSRTVIFILLTICLPVSLIAGPRKTLRIYWVDVEGGGATLIVTPAGESILVDAGWAGFDGRDAKRIQEAMKAGGVTRIDHLIVTHYHADHIGGVPELARLVPIRNFYNHGPLVTPTENNAQQGQYDSYIAAAEQPIIIVTPGNSIKLKSAPGTPAPTLRFLAARGEVVGTASGKANPVCEAATDMAADKTDNARSVVFKLTYGRFTFLHTGDLTWNNERKLVCPVNGIGKVDLFQTGHHGTNTSGNPVLLATAAPTVAVMNNGPRKGGHQDYVRRLSEVPSIKAMYQIHQNLSTTPEQNTRPDLIANLDESGAYMIWASVAPSARTFAITNGRTSVRQVFRVK